jgi:hypothetical protein
MTPATFPDPDEAATPSTETPPRNRRGRLFGSPRRSPDDGRGLARPIELAATIAFAVWSAWPFIRTDRYAAGFDTVAYSGPNFAQTRWQWAHWGLPAWNDTIFSGVPHLASPQAAVLYFPKLLAFGSTTTRGMGWMVAAHLVWMAVGMVLFARHSLRLAPPAGFVAGVALVASGPIMAKAIQFEQMMVIAWAPWLMLGTGAALRNWRPRRAIVLLAVALAGALHAGHPQLVFIITPLIVVAALGEWLQAGRRPPLLRVGAALGLGLGLSALQVGSLALFTRTSAFSGGQRADVVRNPSYSIDPRAFPQNILGDVYTSDHAFTARNFEGIALVGTSVAVLMLTAVVLMVVRRHRRNELALWMATGATAFLLALGPRFGLYRVAAKLVPFFNQARVPGRWVVPWAIAASVLAAVAVDAVRGGVGPMESKSAPELRKSTPRTRWRKAPALWVAAVWFGLLGTATVTNHLFTSIDRPATRTLDVWIVISVLAIAAVAIAQRMERSRLGAAIFLALLVAVEMASMSTKSFGRHLLKPVAPESYRSAISTRLAHETGRSVAMTDDKLGEPDYLVRTLRPNTNSFLLTVRSFDGYDGGPQVTKRWTAVAGLFTAPFDTQLTLRSQLATISPALAARYGIRWVLVETADRDLAKAAPGWKGPIAVDGTVVLMENPAFVGEAVLHPGAIAATGAADALRQVQSLPAAAIVEGIDTNLPSCASGDACASVAGRVTNRHPGHVVVKTAATTAGVLTIDEQYADGWTAEVDGRSSKVVPVDGLLAGVVLGPGPHTVSFTYRIPLLIPFLAVMALSGLLCLALVGAPQVRRVRRSSTRRSSTRRSSMR